MGSTTKASATICPYWATLGRQILKLAVVFNKFKKYIFFTSMLSLIGVDTCVAANVLFGHRDTWMSKCTHSGESVEMYM